MAMAMMMEGRRSDGDGGGKGVRAEGGSAGGDNARLGFARVDTVTDNAGPNRARHRSSQRTDRRRRLGHKKAKQNSICYCIRRMATDKGYMFTFTINRRRARHLGRGDEKDYGRTGGRGGTAREAQRLTPNEASGHDALVTDIIAQGGNVARKSLKSL